MFLRLLSSILADNRIILSERKSLHITTYNYLTKIFGNLFIDTICEVMKKYYLWTFFEKYSQLVSIIL